jgi:hypothetical protein
VTSPSIDSRADRMLALAIELVAFELRVMAWTLLIWAPLAGACILLFFASDDVKRDIAIVLLCLPLLGLLLKWVSTGLFDLKLGRMIVVLLFSAGFALLQLVVVVLAFLSKLPGIVSLLLSLVIFSFVAATLGYGLVRRNSLLR